MSKKLLVAAGLLLVALLLLLAALPRDKAVVRPPAAPAANPVPSPARQAPQARPDSAPAIDAAMPAGLAEDLAMFNSEQLRAELESIALSHPAVSVLSVACDSRPCTAEVQVSREPGEADERASLDAFLDLVSKRFQGYLTASFRELDLPGDVHAVRALLVVGGSAPHPAPRVPR